MKRPKVLGIIMAGGKGERLFPLTKERGKPAVPFGGKYRIIDFVMSNFVNSQILSIYVLVQYMSQSLIDYLRVAWRNRGLIQDHFITVVPPQMRIGEMWYRGTADAVAQNLNLIQDFDPDIVMVFGSDHIYRMDIGQMLNYHIDKGADVTVAALPVALEKAKSFGIIEATKAGRVVGFEEKPKSPKPIPGNEGMAYSSMGNYVFNRDILEKILVEDTKRGESAHDFGKNIIPELLGSCKVFAYDFLKADLPGLKPHEEKGYWRDVGDIESFWSANMDLLGEHPRMDLDNEEWPIYASRYDGPSARIFGGECRDAIIGDGSIVRSATVRHSVIGRAVKIHPGAVVEDCVVMDFTEIGPGARLNRAIVDRFNNIPADTDVGYDQSKDEKRYHVDKSGIVVLSRGRAKWAHLKR
ncbi:MAG TPA: glucose-1-phosphate adenylyltransferase [Elusimicrobiota bacterium]|nr:glucose-1-phosphate adenylyltransferase [Elusimicrobiota bacterium]